MPSISSVSPYTSEVLDIAAQLSGLNQCRDELLAADTVTALDRALRGI